MPRTQVSTAIAIGPFHGAPLSRRCHASQPRNTGSSSPTVGLVSRAKAQPIPYAAQVRPWCEWRAALIPRSSASTRGRRYRKIKRGAKERGEKKRGEALVPDPFQRKENGGRKQDPGPAGGQRDSAAE